MIKALEIQEGGYPAKYSYQEFVSPHNYELLAHHPDVAAGLNGVTDPSAVCEAVFALHPGLVLVHEKDEAGLPGMQWGANQLYFRSKAKTVLDVVKFEDQQAAHVSQAGRIIDQALSTAASSSSECGRVRHTFTLCR